MKTLLITSSDPYAYVVSANVKRRHLSAKQKRELIAELLKARTEDSNRQIAEMAKVDDKTVGSVRRELEECAEIPHVKKHKDTKGRKQPARKRAKSPRRHIVISGTAVCGALSEPDRGDVAPDGAGEGTQLRAEEAKAATKLDDDVRCVAEDLNARVAGIGAEQREELLRMVREFIADLPIPENLREAS